LRRKTSASTSPLKRYSFQPPPMRGDILSEGQFAPKFGCSWIINVPSLHLLFTLFFIETAWSSKRAFYIYAPNKNMALQESFCLPCSFPLSYPFSPLFHHFHSSLPRLPLLAIKMALWSHLSVGCMPRSACRLFHSSLLRIQRKTKSK